MKIENQAPVVKVTRTTPPLPVWAVLAIAAAFLMAGYFVYSDMTAHNERLEHRATE